MVVGGGVGVVGGSNNDGVMAGSSDDLFAHQMQTDVTRCSSRSILTPLLGGALTPYTFHRSSFAGA